MIEVFFVLFVACAADATEVTECGASISPFWIMSEEECERWLEDQMPSVLAYNGFASPALIQVCLGVDLPIPTGEPT